MPSETPWLQACVLVDAALLQGAALASQAVDMKAEAAAEALADGVGEAAESEAMAEGQEEGEAAES